MELKTLIVSVIGENASPRSMSEFVFVCRKIALVHLRRKLSKGRLSLQFFSSSLEDLAMDCISDLFQRDEQGRLVQIQSYFDSLRVDTLTEEELLSHLRRLVFGKTNFGLFRIYNEIDPSLGKILRNIKLSIQGLQHFETVERFGEQCIVPVTCESLEHLLPLERSQLESELRERIGKTEHIPSLLAQLAQYLREQNNYSRIVSLVDVAVVFRSLFAETVPDDVGHNPIERLLEVEDARRIIREACASVKNKYNGKYVGKRKVTEEMYSAYFTVIEENLEQTILLNDGEDFSFYERLNAIIPKLTKDDYQQNYKSQIEYLGRLTHKQAVKMLKKQL